MGHDHQIVSPGTREGQVVSQSGREMKPPRGWAFLPAGAAAVTRKVKAMGPVWVVQVTRGRRSISQGIWADAAHIQSAMAAVAARRADPAWARAQQRALERRRSVQDAYEKDFFKAVRSFLGFHPRYSREERELACRVTGHAAPVGSGSVARTQRIPIDQRAGAAVIAWMRHKTTAYETLKIPRIKGRRRAVRRHLAQESLKILAAYRTGGNIDGNCPLKRALDLDP